MSLVKETAKHLTPFLEKYYRAKYEGLENIPDTSFLGVGNHLGVYFLPETYLWLGKYHGMKNKPKMKVLVHHMLHELALSLKFPESEFGIIDASPGKAIEALKSGDAVTVYPGGDRENSKPFKDRNKIQFYGHHGYIRLALRSGVPILPIVGCGGGETLFVLSSGEKFAKKSGLTSAFKIHTWPVYWSLPFGLRVGHFPFFSIPLPSQVTISVLPAIYLDDYSAEDADDKDKVEEINKMVVSKMQEKLDELAKGRIPIIGKL
jgi:1-acyl-sn-glycerol-3-phosphate acyltransferase